MSVTTSTEDRERMQIAQQLGEIKGMLKAAVGEDGQGGTLGAVRADVKAVADALQAHKEEDTDNFAAVHARISKSREETAGSLGTLKGIGIAVGSGCGIIVAIIEIVRYLKHG